MTRRSLASRVLRRVLLFCLLVIAGVVVWQAATWPSLAELARRPPTTTAFIERYNERERAAGRQGRAAIAWVPYSSVSPSAKRAVLVAEDINFFSHHGFDWGEIGNAIEETLGERGRARGASTISQQLAKNLWLSPGQNPLRKAKEAMLTWQLEHALPKRRILELYLNVVEFGPGIYGVGPAAQFYFGKPASDLDEAEAAQLAAALPRPRSWHPGSRSAAYQRYVAAIRARMDKAEFLKKQI